MPNLQENPASVNPPQSPKISEPLVDPSGGHFKPIHRSAGRNLVRAVLGEFIGTFIIVFLGCGAIIGLHGTGAAEHLTVCLVFGGAVMTMVYALGHVAGPHFDPAVTLAFATIKHIKPSHAAAYIGAQLAGATMGAATLGLALGAKAQDVNFGANHPSISAPAAFVLEIVFSFILMLVIMGTGTDKRVPHTVPGFAIGTTVAIAALFGGPVSGVSMNPARSLGPALLAGGSALGTVWIYLLAPCIGMVLAALTYQFLRGDVFPHPED